MIITAWTSQVEVDDDDFAECFNVQIKTHRSQVFFEWNERETREIRDALTDLLMDAAPKAPDMKFTDLGSIGYRDLGPDPDDDMPF